MSEQQEQIKIDGVILPYKIVDGVEYFPIKYTLEKILLKSCSKFYIKEEYKSYIKKCIIDWSFTGTVPQESNCINKEGWIYYIKHCKLNKNKDPNKIKRNNLFCDFIEYKEGRISDVLNNDELYDDYINDCIEYFKARNKLVKSKVCCNCGRELPNSHYFFCKDNRIKGGLTYTCRLCFNNSPYFVDNDIVRDIYKNFGAIGYSLYKKDIYEFYKKYIHNQNKYILKFQKEYDSVKFVLNIVKEEYDNGNIDIIDLNKEIVINRYSNKIKFSTSKITNKLINEYCSDNDCKIRPYLYPNYKLGSVSYKEANIILNTYIMDNNIIIDDIFTYNYYEKLVKDAKLSQYTKRDLLEFIVQYYNYKYAGYKFKLKSYNYYTNKENSIFDMKWFIEKDKNIPINKIPLYVTKTSLSYNARSLYIALYNNKYFSSLYEWINACYPNMYTENDFDMNPYRCEFDSLEESQIHDKLINNLTGVVYNARNRPDTIEINGMIPDWIICNDKGCYLVEYFGLFSNRNYNNSDRLIKYHKKMDIKMKKYKEIEKVGYKTLFIYPDDIRNGFDGLMNKIEIIK